MNDRINPYDRITGATLNFSDGSSLSVGSLDNYGEALITDFTPRAITSIRLTLDSVASGTAMLVWRKLRFMGYFSNGECQP